MEIFYNISKLNTGKNVFVCIDFLVCNEGSAKSHHAEEARILINFNFLL
jgi:hypothetical protein